MHPADGCLTIWRISVCRAPQLYKMVSQYDTDRAWDTSNYHHKLSVSNSGEWDRLSHPDAAFIRSNSSRERADTKSDKLVLSSSATVTGRLAGLRETPS